MLRSHIPSVRRRVGAGAPAGPGGPPSPGLGPAPEGRQFGEPNRSPDEVSFVTNVNDKHYYIT